LGYYRDLGVPIELYLHDLIEEVLRVYKSKMQTRGITVVRDFDDARPIIASKGELVQVFSNVIANAIDAMSLGGSLFIQIRGNHNGSGDELQVVIRDQGTGIEAEHLTKVFEPFFTTKGNLGTGIGLWVAKQLAEKRGGQITLTSSTVPEKRGTDIVISIPFTQLPINIVDAIGIKSEFGLMRLPS
jgi:signal transduction histidine kinase